MTPPPSSSMMDPPMVATRPVVRVSLPDGAAPGTVPGLRMGRGVRPSSAAAVAARAPAGRGIERPDDWALLRRYLEVGSQDAFTELVSRHLPWVHSMCRRGLRDLQLAEDAAQAVFLLLARRANTISPSVHLAGWLFNTARFVVKDARKGQSRYVRRQQVAQEMARDRQSAHMRRAPEPVDPQLQATLDECLGRLSGRDREALIMHFYEGLSLQEMAGRLDISREGTKKRVSRALQRLRDKLAAKLPTAAARMRRGSGTEAGSGDSGPSLGRPAGGNGARGLLAIGAVAALLRAQGAQAMPIGLAGRVVGAVARPGLASAAAEQIARGVAQVLSTGARRLLRAVLAGQVVLGALVGGVAVLGPGGERRAAMPPARPAQVATVAGANAPASPVAMTASRSAVRSNDEPAPAAARGAEPRPVTDRPDIPYRSGADDPEPEEKVSPADPAPEDKTQGVHPVALSVGSGPGGGGAGTAAGGGTVPGSTFANLAPVQRTPAREEALAAVRGEARPFTFASPSTGAGAGRGGMPLTEFHAPRAPAREGAGGAAPRDADAPAGEMELVVWACRLLSEQGNVQQGILILPADAFAAGGNTDWSGYPLFQLLRGPDGGASTGSDAGGAGGATAQGQGPGAGGPLQGPDTADAGAAPREPGRADAAGDAASPGSGRPRQWNGFSWARLRIAGVRRSWDNSSLYIDLGPEPYKLDAVGKLTDWDRDMSEFELVLIGGKPLPEDLEKLFGGKLPAELEGIDWSGWSAQQAPEPSAGLMLLGAATLLLRRRRR